MRLTSFQRILCHLSIFALLFSGIVWLIINFYTDYDSPLHFLNAWSLKIHGSASYLFLIAFGMIISTHISFNWRVKKNRRKSGIITTALFSILIISGYLLYYVAGDEIRTFISYLHWICGILCSAFFIFHFATKTKQAQKKRQP